MQDLLTVTGLILKAEPIGEYDRRVVILTKERGKITAFARGARKQNNRFLAPTNPFSFGEFRLYAGRSSYTLAEAFISNYFEGLRSDYEGAYYGMYFLEVCDYCTRENNDERELLKLLYQSLRALTAKSLEHELVRYIFESGNKRRISGDTCRRKAAGLYCLCHILYCGLACGKALYLYSDAPCPS